MFGSFWYKEKLDAKRCNMGQRKYLLWYEAVPIYPEIQFAIGQEAKAEQSSL
jgi:hypothetical protein